MVCKLTARASFALLQTRSQRQEGSVSRGHPSIKAETLSCFCFASAAGFDHLRAPASVSVTAWDEFQATKDDYGDVNVQDFFRWLERYDPDEGRTTWSVSNCISSLRVPRC